MYDTHITQAFRYAATALVERPGRDVDREALEALHRDAAVVLLEMVRVTAGMRPRHGRPAKITEVANHPVRMLLNHLDTLAHPGLPPAQVPPSQRWAGRPDTPGAVTDAISAWKGVVVAAVQARHALETEKRPASVRKSDRAWTVLGDVATLAEVLAVAKADLFQQTATELERRGPTRLQLASLQVEAREVARLAAASDTTTFDTVLPGTSRALGVFTVPSSDRLPAAVQNLSRILASEQPSAPDLLAVTRVLAQTSRAAAETLVAVADTTPQETRVARLSATAAALAAHADHLAHAATAHQARLGSVTQGSAVLTAQARELGAIAVPGLRTLAGRPTAAHAAAAHLLQYAEILPAVTDALRHAVVNLDARGLVFIRDRSDDAETAWRPTRPGDLHNLTTQLASAAVVARSAPQPVRTAPTPALPVARVAAAGAITDLQGALQRRQAALRPVRPASPLLDHRELAPVIR